MFSKRDGWILLPSLEQSSQLLRCSLACFTDRRYVQSFDFFFWQYIIRSLHSTNTLPRFLFKFQPQYYWDNEPCRIIQMSIKPRLFHAIKSTCSLYTHISTKRYSSPEWFSGGSTYVALHYTSLHLPKDEDEIRPLEGMRTFFAKPE